MFTYEIQPHPTQKGKLLAVTVKRAGGCASKEECAFEMIGGKYWRPMGRKVKASPEMLRDFASAHPAGNFHGPGTPEAVTYTLSTAQARDLDIILRAGFLPTRGPAASYYVEGLSPDERTFLHPDHGEREFTRVEALEIAAPPARCRRTLELPLAA